MKVSTADYSSRQSVVFDESQRSSQAVCKVHLCGGGFGAGVFMQESDEGGHRIDWYQLLRAHGFAALLKALTVWDVTKTSAIDVSLPHAGCQGAAMLSLDRAERGASMALAVKKSRRHTEFFSVLGALASRGGATFIYNVQSQELCNDDGSFRLGLDSLMLSEMVDQGVLLESSNEFAERCFTVSMDAVKWKPSSEIRHGSKSPTAHLERLSPWKLGKVELILRLQQRGWDLGSALEETLICPASQRKFLLCFSRPRSFFHCLLECETVFAKLAVDEAHLP